MTNDKDGVCPCWGTDKEVEQLRAELDAARKVHAQLSKDYHVKHLNYEKLERENAQLAAATVIIREFKVATAFVTTMRPGAANAFAKPLLMADTFQRDASASLRDLLLPHISKTTLLVSWLESHIGIGAHLELMSLLKDCKDELTRLSSLCGEKGTYAKRIH